MTGRYKAYPECKDSGVEWLKEMPVHWELLKAKHIFKKVQRPVRPEDGIVTAFRDGEVTLRSNRRTDGFTNAAKEIGYQGVRKGDLLVHAMDGFAGAIGISDSNGKCSPVCSVCTPWQLSRINSKYYGYLVRQLAVTDYITSLAKGIRERSTEFRFNEFSSLFLAMPPKVEQQKIANFLDHETAKIDTLIAKQEKLIELLKEKRQAVISHAVTKGLNPQVPMRDSGVEWLGEVPEHWLIGSLRWKVSISSGEGLSSNLVEKNKTELKKIPVIGGNGVMGFSESSNTHKTAIAIGRVGALCGNVHLINYISWITDNALKISSWDGFDENYLISLLKAANLNDLASTTAQPLITGEQIKSLIVVIPPLKEQIKINLKLTKIVNLFDKLEKRSKDGINLLKERKTALISAAVTGKIDVRNWKVGES